MIHIFMYLALKGWMYDLYCNSRPICSNKVQATYLPGLSLLPLRPPPHFPCFSIIFQMCYLYVNENSFSVSDRLMMIHPGDKATNKPGDSVIILSDLYTTSQTMDCFHTMSKVAYIWMIIWKSVSKDDILVHVHVHHCEMRISNDGPEVPLSSSRISQITQRYITVCACPDL